MSEPITVAIVLNADGTLYDRCYNWETGQNYALSEGRRVIAVNHDGSMTIEEQQALYDAERERYNDCFGADVPTTSFYLVAVDDNGDVMAAPAKFVDREGLTITISTADKTREDFAFENQGDDATSKWESARDALAAVMPDDEEED